MPHSLSIEIIFCHKSFNHLVFMSLENSVCFVFLYSWQLGCQITDTYRGSMAVPKNSWRHNISLDCFTNAIIAIHIVYKGRNDPQESKVMTNILE